MTRPHRSLCEALLAHASERPDAEAFRFLTDGEVDTASITYEELLGRAFAVANGLREVARPQDRAVLLYEPGIEFLAGLLGCFFASTIAVPAYPPDTVRLERWSSRMHGILASAKPAVLLTSSYVGDHEAALKAALPAFADVRWVVTDHLRPEKGAPRSAECEIAMLQYTSGSTGTPKGVMLTHANLMANARHLCAFFPAERVGVNWLPPYHDMGLMGQLLQPLYMGFQSVFMSPLHFLQNPDRWLRAITRYKGTIIVGPNFAYDLCVRKSKETALDLSSVRVAFNGAEPVRPHTIRSFVEKFRPYGFDERAFLPCYGLAESTLIATGRPHFAGASTVVVGRDALKRGTASTPGPGEEPNELVSCGAVVSELELLVVDPETRRVLPERAIGEIWLRGASVARGYYDRPEDTESAFGAYLDTGEGPYLRTGDLGFMLAGELCVSGRVKDVIIVRGQNHYPQDVELTIERAHPRIRRGCVAVFATIKDGQEAAAAVVEIDARPTEPREFKELEAAVLESVARDHGLQLAGFGVLPPGTIPKTSSGKLMRAETRAAYLSGALPLIERGTQ